MSAEQNQSTPAGPSNVVDPATGLPRVLSRKCGTCIFRRPGRALVGPERRDEVAQRAVENDSWVICHDTLPYGKHEVPPGEQAICRGFWDTHRRDSLGCRMAVVLGGPIEVDPPGPSPSAGD